ncbi:MAG: hypothetical protein HY298_07935 [Verrucomicrobia bacterium]|nr:hypothetical protein [Verrucomicrobiota bacterium]
MKVVAANRRELWISMLVVIAAVCVSSIPVTFDGALMLAAAMVIGLLCAVNAVLDIDEMGVVETYVAVLWLIALMIMTPLTLYWVASIRDFANK